MIFLDLFLTFLKVGAVSFGGGYGMISLIREEVVYIHKWINEEFFLNLIAVAESTPGPIAINMATFIGSSASGSVWGSLLATLGVITPSFLIILIISIFAKGFLKYNWVQGVLKGVRPVIAGLITATGITMAMGALFGYKTLQDSFTFDIRPIIILAIIIGLDLLFKKLLKRKLSPILLIITSALLGMLLYCF